MCLQKNQAYNNSPKKANTAAAKKAWLISNVMESRLLSLECTSCSMLGLNQIQLFKRFGCCDAGVQCGDWGKVVMEIKMEKHQKRRN